MQKEREERACGTLSRKDRMPMACLRCARPLRLRCSVAIMGHDRAKPSRSIPPSRSNQPQPLIHLATQPPGTKLDERWREVQALAERTQMCLPEPMRALVVLLPQCAFGAGGMSCNQSSTARYPRQSTCAGNRCCAIALRAWQASRVARCSSRASKPMELHKTPTVSKANRQCHAKHWRQFSVQRSRKHGARIAEHRPPLRAPRTLQA